MDYADVARTQHFNSYRWDGLEKIAHDYDKKQLIAMTPEYSDALEHVLNPVETLSQTSDQKMQRILL
jgi:hypothetical protein